ncbi:hypothetical protein K439DRAFT_811587 [Ramaria rubella]|nr:hypothetical protein K439DRAFT_811587 [Ramaria rubella]
MATRSQSRCSSKSPSSTPYSLPRPSKHRPRRKIFPSVMEESESVSYIIIHDLSPEAKMLYLSPSLTEVLGYDPVDIIGTSSFDWIHPDEVEAARQLHHDTIRYDKAAAMAYLRVKNQDDRYVQCVIQRSMVHNALIGSISFAKPGAKALHTAATAQEVTFLTPGAVQTHLEFRKWNDPSPLPIPMPSLPPNPAYAASFLNLPTPSQRTGLILNRFSRLCTILYCTNDCILPPATVNNRSLYDFVVPADEQNVRSWIDVSKGWGVSDSGHPSDGGFVFGSFRVCLAGRDSAAGSSGSGSGRGRGRSTSSAASNTNANANAATTHAPDAELAVDAIFSAHSDGFIVVLRKAGNV